MFYDEEFDEEYEDIDFLTEPRTNTSQQTAHENAHIIILNGDQPAVQNKIAQELINLAAKPFTHINIYQQLMGLSIGQKSEHGLESFIEEIHAKIISLANHGNNLIISHNPIFDFEQAKLSQKLQRFSSFWVNLTPTNNSPVKPDLEINIYELSIIKATFIIYQSILKTDHVKNRFHQL
jgi:hypothetical protein